MSAYRLEGTVERLISDSGPACICCEGGRRVDPDSANPPLSEYSNRRDMASWLHDVQRSVPDGSRIRITVTVERETP